MIFTSYTYIVFLAMAFVLHWSLPARARKIFLVLASYFFYCFWDWQKLHGALGLLLLGVSLFNWCYARWVLVRAQTMTALAIGVCVNLGALLYFKYTIFLLTNIAAFGHFFGSHWEAPHWDIILPLGISFFTFQGIAYLFDVATGEEPLDSLLDFLLFKALWPQLIAGPIVRIDEMRGQLTTPRRLGYDNVAYGCQRIIFGFFKKIVLADNIGPTVDMVFHANAHPAFIDCGTAILGFGMQIYFDFSAYSDIAIGTARLFGFVFPENFNWPYVSRSPREFWNRWHITLSRWIRDYLFTPISFAARSRPRLAPLWLLVAMALCGLWHGAKWTFVIWGTWHGVLLVLNQTRLKALFPPGEEEKPGIPLGRAFVGWALTFVLVQVGWLFFRADSTPQAMSMLKTLLTFQGHLKPAVLRENAILFVACVFAALMCAQALRGTLSRMRSGSASFDLMVRAFRPVAYALMIVAAIVFDQEARTFVYFQF